MEAKRHIDSFREISFCTDGSRLDSGRTAAGVSWYDHECRMQKNYLGTNKEGFDAELYAIGEALEIVLKNGRVGREASSQTSKPRWEKIHIWADPQVAIK